MKLILGKVRVDGFNGSQSEVDIRYEFCLKVILKGLVCKQELLLLFLIEFPSIT